jgi:hypothetical protein
LKFADTSRDSEAEQPVPQILEFQPEQQFDLRMVRAQGGVLRAEVPIDPAGNTELRGQAKCFQLELRTGTQNGPVCVFVPKLSGRSMSKR